MSKLLDDVLNFLSSATGEELKENWKYLEPYEDVGPNAEDFVKEKLQENKNKDLD